MRAAVLLTVVALVACSGGSTSVKAPSASPTMSPLASASPSADASASPTAPPIAIPKPVVTITSAGKSLACRLPVTWEFQLDDYTRLHMAGFMTFPTGVVTQFSSADSSSRNSVFYDRAYSKWLPVWRYDVSPDGRHYSYTDGNPMLGDTKGRVHVVDVASGVDTVLYSGAPVYRVVDFRAEGIYLTAEPGEGLGRGLWLENAAGGTPRLISRSIVGPVIAGRLAWGLAFNSADPHPAPGGLEGPWNELTQLDLVTGAATTLFYHPGASIDPLGVDPSGALLVAVYGPAGSEEVWLVASATVTRKLATFASAGPAGIAAVDRHGVWYTAGGQPAIVWLYANGVFAIVANISTDSFAVAGGCIP